MPIIDSARSVLVYLANGIQGGAVVRAARRRGFAVRALVRDRTCSAALVAPGVEIVEGDLFDRPSLLAAASGVAHAVLQIPTGPLVQMLEAADGALAASAAAGHRSVILKMASASRPAPCPELGFVANAAVEQKLRSSGLPFAIVRPTMYLDNLLKPSARAEMLTDGLFSPPIAASQRIAWTSADDCAEVAVMLLENGADGGDHLIGGPDSVTGDELARRLSIGLGRRIVYREQALDAFERDVDAALGPGMGRHVGSKFRFFAEHPLEAEAILSVSFRGSASLAGFRPTAIEDWARCHRRHLSAPERP